MNRTLYNSLLAWKQSRRRKPLLLQGARQVGKTYLVNQFGKQEYKDFIYLNFEQNPKLGSLFEQELSPAKIINNISLFTGKKITSENTLIFFDEIQTEPNVLTCLKYFFEQSPEFHIIAAGSLLGVSIGKNTSFPVGKVNFMTLYPMSFSEYLSAFGEETIVEEMEGMKKDEVFPELIHDKLLTHLRLYMYLGGMPEVLNEYLKNKDIAISRQIQNEILEAYKRDFSKYTDKNQAIKTSETWNSIPYQLSKEKKKFKYSDISKNSRSKTYELSIEWLNKAGLVHVVNNINVPKLPLSGYADNSKFKIYMHDTGLLGAMLKLTSSIVLEPTGLFSEYNGAFTENFVATQLISSEIGDLYYWASKSDAEVDFIIEKNNKIYPIEVKSGYSRNKKSLQSYSEKYKPELMFRLSPRNFIDQNNFINIPLYNINRIFNFI
jgi:uncharacterized protein